MNLNSLFAICFSLASICGNLFHWQHSLAGGFFPGAAFGVTAILVMYIYISAIQELYDRFFSTKNGAIYFAVASTLGKDAGLTVFSLNLVRLVIRKAGLMMYLTSYLIYLGMPASVRFLIWVSILLCCTVGTTTRNGNRVSSPKFTLLSTICCVTVVIYFFRLVCCTSLCQTVCCYPCYVRVLFDALYALSPSLAV